MTTSGSERVLVFLLRFSGCVTLSAFFAIFLPVELMVRVHRMLGLGEFPATPLVDYLTRSTAALYAMHGGVMLVASTDVHRFRPVVVYLCLATTLFGTAITIIDAHAGLPWFWTLAEGPPVAMLGLACLYLVRRVRRPSAQPI